MRRLGVLEKLRIVVWSVLLLVGLTGCGNSGTPTTKVDLEKKELLQEAALRPRGNEVRIAVGGMITPKAGIVYYKEFIDYAGKKLGKPVRYVDREKYDEINMLLKSGGIDAAFVCSGPYVDGHDAFGLQLLAAPQAFGSLVYYSYIIVSKDSPINRFEELRGKTFAFTDPLSNTGKLVPEYMLARMNETPDTFFKKYFFTYGHDKAIKAVAQGVADGAAVDSLVWEYESRTDPQFTSKTKIIQKSPPYAIPPVVVRKDLDPELKKELRRIFLNADVDEEGKAILKKMMIDKFVVIHDSAYASVREMKVRLARQKLKMRNVP